MIALYPGSTGWIELGPLILTFLKGQCSCVPDSSLHRWCLLLILDSIPRWLHRPLSAWFPAPVHPPSRAAPDASTSGPCTTNCLWSLWQCLSRVSAHHSWLFSCPGTLCCLPLNSNSTGSLLWLVSTSLLGKVTAAQPGHFRICF